MIETSKCAKCGDEIPPRPSRPDDTILFVCDSGKCQEELRRKTSPYPESFCSHGYKPEYCAECLIAGAAPRLKYKGTRNGSSSPSRYIYITAPEKPEHNLPQQASRQPQSPRLSRVEVLAPCPRSAPVIAIPDRCPHGGVIVNGLAYCGHCSGAIPGDANAFQIFLADLYRICGYEGRRVYFNRIDNNEMTQHAFVNVLAKLKHILKAKEPSAMARVIARNAISDLKKKSYNWKEWSYSDLTVYAADQGDDQKSGRVFSPTEITESLSIKHNPYYAFLIDPEHVESHVGGTDYNIPGGEKLWVPNCYRQMEILLEAAMASLPRPPIDGVPMAIDMMVKRWVGYFDEIGKQTYDDIAQECPPGTTPRQVKYLIQKGIREAGEYMVSHAKTIGHTTRKSWLQSLQKKKVNK
jgi:hypothetical protein